MPKALPFLCAFLLALSSLACDDGDSSSEDLSVLEDTEDSKISVPADLAEEVDTALPDQREEVDIEEPDPTEALYDPNHLMEVELSIEEEDWDTLRHQSRTLTDIIGPGCLDSPANDPFTYQRADLVVDGTLLEEVGVRKKGFLGSLSTSRPSLKIKVDKYVDDVEYLGVERLTFNNVQQDITKLNTCLAYQLFNHAGVPAPRCNFAHVQVNEQDLGVYVHVESVKKRFLRRHFDDDEGALFEGALSDFRPGWTGTLEQKTNGDTPMFDQVDRLTQALEADDEHLMESLEAVIDLDAFYTFWAMEVLVGHWDGYTGNTNNFFIYFDPASERAYFMPWGADSAFLDHRAFNPEASPPTSVMAQGYLALRLYQHPEGRQAYQERLRQLLDSVWDEDAIQSEVNRMSALVDPFIEEDKRGEWIASVAAMRTYVEGRRAAILDELDNGEVAWEQDPREEPCAEDIGAVEGALTTTWGTHTHPNLFFTGSGSLTVDLVEEEALTCDPIGGKAGMGTEPDDLGYAMLTLAGVLPDGTMPFLVVKTFPENIHDGATIPLDWSAAEGYTFIYYPETEEVEFIGLLAAGEVRIIAAGLEDGDPIQAQIEARIWLL